jgi:hypothetical protein
LGFVFATLSDHYKRRAIFIVIQTLMTILGMLLAIYAPQNGVRYFGKFFCLDEVAAFG